MVSRFARWYDERPVAGDACLVGARLPGLGGTLGLSGSFEDPTEFREASLRAGAVLLLVGVGALAFVRPWGLRLRARPSPWRTR